MLLQPTPVLAREIQLEHTLRDHDDDLQAQCVEICCKQTGRDLRTWRRGEEGEATGLPQLGGGVGQQGESKKTKLYY